MTPPTRLLLPLLLSLSTAATAAELETYESRHYDLLTDLPRAEAREVLSFCEAMYKSYSKVFPDEPLKESPRPTVRVYRELADYEAYGRADPDLDFSVNWHGCYVRDRNELVTCRRGTLSALKSLLSHEGLHQFAWTFLVPGTEKADELPSWLEEGLGEYYRTSEVRRGRLKLKPLDYHWRRCQRALREGWFWTLDQLWDCDPGKLEDKNVFDAFYAHAYLFVSFLAEHDRERLLRLVRHKREGKLKAELMELEFGEVDRARLREAFQAYVRRGLR